MNPTLQRSRGWEDRTRLLEVLAPQPGERVLVAGDTGDLGLALALAGAEVWSWLPTQPERALVELTLRSLALPWEERLQLLGWLEPGRRVGSYHAVRGSLSGGSRSFWDANEALVRSGLREAGALERLLATTRRALALGAAGVLEDLQGCEEPAAQGRLLDRAPHALALLRLGFAAPARRRAGLRLPRGSSRRLLARVRSIADQRLLRELPSMSWLFPPTELPGPGDPAHLQRCPPGPLLEAALRLHTTETLPTIAFDAVVLAGLASMEQAALLQRADRAVTWTPGPGLVAVTGDASFALAPLHLKGGAGGRVPT